MVWKSRQGLHLDNTEDYLWIGSMNSRSRHDYSTACRRHRRLVLLLLALGTACGALVVLLLPLAVNVSNTDGIVSADFLNSENSKTNKNNNRIIAIAAAAAATTINDDARRNMVGGYSSALDVDLPEIKNVANFVLDELLAMMSPTTRGETTKETTTTVVTTTTLDNTIIRQMIEAQRQNSNNTINVEVLRARRQVVAGMNYKLTLAIFTMNNTSSNNGSNEEHDNNSNNEETTNTTSSCCCLGGIENIIIYQPLPHTGSSYDIVSWGTVLTCDTVLTMMVRTKETQFDVEGKNIEQEE